MLEQLTLTKQKGKKPQNPKRPQNVSQAQPTFCTFVTKPNGRIEGNAVLSPERVTFHRFHSSFRHPAATETPPKPHRTRSLRGDPWVTRRQAKPNLYAARPLPCLLRASPPGQSIYCYFQPPLRREPPLHLLPAAPQGPVTVLAAGRGNPAVSRPGSAAVRGDRRRAAFTGSRSVIRRPQAARRSTPHATIALPTPSAPGYPGSPPRPLRCH